MAELGNLQLVSWLAIYGFMTADSWLLGHAPTTGSFLEYMRGHLGRSLMLVVIFSVMYFR
jgi:arabinofuranan 3-O-arabinosyltransferase